MLDMIKAVFIAGPFKYKLMFVSAGLILFACCGVLLVFPLSFNYFIIPNIEAKTERRIIFPEFTRYFVLGGFLYRYPLVARYIAKSYFLFKFKGRIEALSVGVLAGLNYNIEMMSKFEITMSIMVYIIDVLLIFGVLGVYVASGQLHLFLN